MLQLLQVGVGPEPVLLRERRLHGERIGVEERGLVEQREAALLLERLGRGVRGVGGLRRQLLALDRKDDLARVLGVDVDLPAGQGLVDDLRTPDVVVELHLEAPGLQGLLVELPEDERLREVLSAELDRRLALARLPRHRRGARLLLASAGRDTDRQHDGKYDQQRGA